MKLKAKKSIKCIKCGKEIKTGETYYLEEMSK
jgi:PHP family Zn ribbon phosphoesterase